MNELEVQKCFEALDLRERLVMKFALLAGLRPGEIFGLNGPMWWRRMPISSSASIVAISTAQKSTHSCRKAALASGLIEDILVWRDIARDSSAQAWVFPSEKETAPLRKDNIWRRRIQLRLKALGLDWVDFHVTRRTHATLMNELNDDPKLVADQLGHTIDVNQNVYTRKSVAKRKDSRGRT